MLWTLLRIELFREAACEHHHRRTMGVVVRSKNIRMLSNAL